MFWLYLTSYIVTSLSLQALYCVRDADPSSQAWLLLERGFDAFDPLVSPLSTNCVEPRAELRLDVYQAQLLFLCLTRSAAPDRECGVGSTIGVHAIGAVGALLTLVLFPALIYWKLSGLSRYHGAGMKAGRLD